MTQKEENRQMTREEVRGELNRRMKEFIGELIDEAHKHLPPSESFDEVLGVLVIAMSTTIMTFHDLGAIAIRDAAENANSALEGEDTDELLRINKEVATLTAKKVGEEIKEMVSEGLKQKRNLP